MKQQTMDERFATESIPRLIMSLSIPAIAAQIVNALYNVVDRMYIARIPGSGSMALTGVGLVFPIIMIISAFAALVGYGGAPLASIRMGEGNHDLAEKIMGNCFTLLLFLSIVLTALLFFFKTPLLILFGASEQTLPYALDYLGVYLWGTIGVQMALGMNQFLSAEGRAKTAMGTVCLGAALNILLDPLFIFVFQMGVKGAAWATVISQMISAGWVLWFLFRSKNSTLRLRRKNYPVDWKLAGSILALGLSPFIMQSTESLVQVTFNTSLLRYGGDLYVGAMVIMTSILQFFMMPVKGFAQGAQPIVSYNYGAGNYKRVKSAIAYTSIFCFVSGFLFWCVCVFFPRLPIRLFVDGGDSATMSLTASLMPIFMSGLVIFGFQMAFQQCFVALGQAKASIFIATLRKIILLIPLILLLPHFIKPETTAIILAEPISDSISAITCITLFLIRAKHLLHQPEGPQAAPPTGK